MRRRFPYWISLLLALTACARGPVKVSSSADQAPAARAPAERQAGSDASSPGQPGRRGHVLTIHRDHLLLDGARLERAREDQGGMVNVLFDALRPGSRQAGTGTPILSSEEPQPYELAVADDATMGWIKRAIQTAGFARYAPATFDLGSEWLLVRPLIPAAAGEQDSGPPLPDPALVILQRDEVTELWRVPTREVADPALGAKLLSTLPARAPAPELRRAFENACAAMTCSPAVLFASSDVPFSQVRPVFISFSGAAAAALDARPLLELRVAPPPTHPRALGPPPRVRLGPAAIRETVRANHERFRKCYLSALQDEPTLKGRISVRLVIAEDGSVASVDVASSDLPDPVGQCVTAEFRKLVFPRPTDGTVKVTYPIVFEPE